MSIFNTEGTILSKTFRENHPDWLRKFLIFIVFIAIIFTCLSGISSYIDRRTPITSEKQFAERVVGVWTYTEPINTSADTFPFDWIKWDIRPGGKMIVYSAKPSDNDWGKGETVDYKIITNKFTDTGERWFGIRQGDTLILGIYNDDKIVLNLRPAYSTTGSMVRGDKNPFSK